MQFINFRFIYLITRFLFCATNFKFCASKSLILVSNSFLYFSSSYIKFPFFKKTQFSLLTLSISLNKSTHFFLDSFNFWLASIRFFSLAFILLCSLFNLSSSFFFVLSHSSSKFYLSFKRF